MNNSTGGSKPEIATGEKHGKRVKRGIAMAVSFVVAAVALAAALLEFWPVDRLPTSLRIAAPSGVSATSGVGQVTLRWAATPGAVWYQVLRADGDGGRFVPLSGTAGRLTGLKRRVLAIIIPGLPLDAVATALYVDTLVEPGRVYRYRVVAWDGERPTEPSEAVRVTARVSTEPEDAAVELHVDAGRDIGPLVHSWEGLTNHASLSGLRDRYASDKRDDRASPVRMLRDDLGVRRVRVHGILGDDLGIYREDASGHPVLDWRGLDVVFDGIRADGCTPWVLLSYMPHDLASRPEKATVWGSNASPPKDLDKWRWLVRELATHLARRYGSDEVASWYFEVWSEPDLHLRKADFWTGTLEEYLQLYDASATALRSVDSRLRVGGPGAASLGTVETFLRHVASVHSPLSFLSMHLYGSGLVDLRPLLARYALGEVPVIYSEWGVSGREEDVHDRPYAAAWIGRVLIEGLGAASMTGYWTATDDLGATTDDELFHGGFGLLAAHGIRKPAYRAFQFLHRLGGRRLATDGSGDGFGGLVQALASRSEDGGLQVLVANATLDQSKAGGSSLLSRHVELRITGLEPGSRYRVTHSRLDNDHAGAFGEWERLGKPATPSNEQLAEIQAADREQALVLEEEESADGEGSLRTSFELPMPALSLVELAPVAASLPD